jgi:uncharacterized protein with FMN-binding domain
MNSAKGRLVFGCLLAIAASPLIVACSGTADAPPGPSPDAPPAGRAAAAPTDAPPGADSAADVKPPQAPAPSQPLSDETPAAASTADTSGSGEQPPAVDETSPLDAALASLQVPPAWYDGVAIHYDTNQPWKEGRLEIRRLLALGGESSREAIKLTCIYREKNDIGDGHEYPMYLYMGGAYAWATKAYIEFTGNLLADPESFSHVHAFLQLASCYAHFKEYDRALATLDTAMKRVPEPPWRIAQTADVHAAYGDMYAAIGQPDKARTHYAEAVRLYPTSDQPYGRHLLKRHADKVQSKIDMLDYRSLATATLRDGTYRTKALGYSGDKDVEVTLTIKSGKIADIQIDHAEKIDQGATKIIPQRIIAAQSLEVDAITGATVTCDAILDGVFRGLKQAGLE